MTNTLDKVSKEIKLARELVEVIRFKDNYIDSLNKNSDPRRTPKKLIDAIIKEIDELVELVVIFYSERIDVEKMEAILLFLESDYGQHLLDLQLIGSSIEFENMLMEWILPIVQRVMPPPPNNSSNFFFGGWEPMNQ